MLILKVAILMFCIFFIGRCKKPPTQIFAKHWLKHEWLEFVMDQITKMSQSPHSVIVWTNNDTSVNRKFSNYITKEFSKSLPTYRIEADGLYISNNITDEGQFRYKITSLLDPSSSIAVLILEEGSDFFKSFNRILDTHITFAPFLSAPKVLVLVHGSKGDSLKSLNYTACFKWAWEQQFIDVTFIYFNDNQKSKPMVIQYRVFDDLFLLKRLSNTTEIFPDQTKNFRGYQLTFGRNHLLWRLCRPGRKL